MLDATESLYERELGGKLLASVSRSFYLTLKALPGGLREPISLAYLLARCADTIADTAQVETGVRLQLLGQFEGFIQSSTSAAVEPWAEVLRSEFAVHQQDAAEKELMLRAAEGLAWQRAVGGRAAVAVREVLSRIISGQKLDLQCFPDAAEVRALVTEEELDDYTYRVAGCVGEFWTQLCVSELDGVFAQGVEVEAMVEAGIQLGKGLQLVNILRDVGKDWKLGRCYLPQAAWAGEITDRRSEVLDGCREEVLGSVWRGLLEKAEGYVAAGERYVRSLKHGRVRYATALPWLLAVATLKRLQAAGWSELLLGSVKVSRLEVAGIMARAAAL
jgi:farnesyl-diphosphate farnesyltransferase